MVMKKYKRGEENIYILRSLENVYVAQEKPCVRMRNLCSKTSASLSKNSKVWEWMQRFSGEREHLANTRKFLWELKYFAS